MNEAIILCECGKPATDDCDSCGVPICDDCTYIDLDGDYLCEKCFDRWMEIELQNYRFARRNIKKIAAVNKKLREEKIQEFEYK